MMARRMALSIVQSLAAADKRIKVIDLSSNSGPACAKMLGLFWPMVIGSRCWTR